MFVDGSKVAPKWRGAHRVILVSVGVHFAAVATVELSVRETETMAQFVAHRITGRRRVCEPFDITARGENLDGLVFGGDIVVLDALSRTAAGGVVLKADYHPVILCDVVAICEDRLIDALSSMCRLIEGVPTGDCPIDPHPAV